jgi:FtsP/CotA-like multicopper oxidase with cupredoxin domain
MSLFLAGLPLLASCARDTQFVQPNDLQHAAGTMSGDTVRLSLVAQRARWRPDSADAHWVTADVFGEEGVAPTIPGPLIRVPLGGHIALTLRNTLADTLLVVGLGARSAGFAEGDTLRVAPGARRFFDVPALPHGTWAFFGATKHDTTAMIAGHGRQLTGIVQVGDTRPGERLIGINIFQAPIDTTKPGGAEWVFWTLNGRMWPATERSTFDVGDTVRWRFVDMTGDRHPMHLHGFYFRVDGRSTWNTDSTFSDAQQRLAVTEAPPPIGSVAITWVPSRPGNWLLHCHKAPHMGSLNHRSLDQDTTEEVMHASMDPAEHMRTGMGGLIMGITVRGPPAAALTDTPSQRMRLLIQRRANVYPHGEEGYGYVLQGVGVPASDSVQIPGPVLTMTRGLLTEITVVNHLPWITTVHWHGIELESYYDGVGGWSGVTGGRLAPIIAPGDSFIVRIRPPRAGTFMYHSHIAEGKTMTRGLLAPLLVLEPGQRYDPATDHVLLMHVNGTGDSAVVEFNGATPAAPLIVAAGVPQRLRFITLMGDDDATISLMSDSTLMPWRPIAKDGASLPAALAIVGPGRVRMSPGETWDMEFTAARGRRLSLHVKSYNNFDVPIRVR